MQQPSRLRRVFTWDGLTPSLRIPAAVAAGVLAFVVLIPTDPVYTLVWVVLIALAIHSYHRRWSTNSPRLRGVLKWGGLLTCPLLLLARGPALFAAGVIIAATESAVLYLVGVLSQRLRWYLRWGGTGSCLLMLAAIVLGTARNVRYESIPTGPGPTYSSCSVGIGGGAIQGCLIEPAVGAFMTGKSGFRFERGGGLWLPWLLTYVQRGWGGVNQHWIIIPLWQPFLLLLIPTVYLWYHDRRPALGHCCGCGYDLTGNKSGRCPECGQSVDGTSNRAHP